MVCDSITNLIGVTCYPLSEDGSVAMLDTPFTFTDGDSAPVFVEKFGGQVRFFDDGEVLLHFAGRGMRLENHRHDKFIRTAAESHGVTLNEAGELEIWASERDASTAFAKFVSTLVALTGWEREQQGVASDLTLLIDEVELCLRAIEPHVPLVPKPEYVGISGQVYNLDFDFGDKAVIAITPHKATVSSAIRKLLDIRSRPGNQSFEAIVVLDDRRDPDAARSEGQVLNAVGNVWPMTRLEQRAKLVRTKYPI